MFGSSIVLFRLFGFEVRVDLSWLVIAVLITWSLASGVFPVTFKGLTTTTYLVMGIAGAVGLFASVVFHELWHSLIARRFGLAITGITLFIFGGVSTMEDEPENPQVEFWMAAAGPLSSIVLGVIFFGVARLGRSLSWPLPVTGVLGYLAYLNVILAIFNLIPAFPLDGGRVLRSILWRSSGDLRRATRLASQIGSGFGLLLILAGVGVMITGNFVGGIWWVLIGMFLRGAAESSWQELQRRTALKGETVRQVMRADPVTVAPSVLVSDFVENYVYRYHYTLFPMVENGRLTGCVSTAEIRTVPRSEWGTRRVGELALACTEGNVIAPDTDALKLLQTMRRTGNTRLMVVERDRLVGIVTLKDLLSFIAVRLDLEG